ncbi:ROK family protein [Arthrobacter sp. efr-133-TYG-118]|uniref:ROK family protein n=1 Tax=Arthrobacter sp. efr-133-TYG-118 TaxID=3040279 RepID=UPI002549CB12|nr:ROK family protein [Arthrobacter sp. efr-133-TYG-118]
MNVLKHSSVPVSRFVVGVDLGGTKVRAGIAGLDGRVLFQMTEPTAPDAGPDLVPQLSALVAALASAVGADVSAVVATAVGGAGVPDGDSGRFERAPNLGELDGFSLAADLEEALGHPVVLENDVNIAALGELHDGVGSAYDSFAFVSVGTGIGVGLILDRRLWAGASGGAGEIGYLPFGADPLNPASHRRGPLEEVVAGDAIGRRYAASSDAAAPEATPDAVEVFDRAGRGDPRAAASLDEEAKWIAHALVAVDAVVNPGLFVLGGGIGTRIELLAPIRAWMTRLGRGDLEVAISRLGPRAPIAGAVRLAIDKALQPQEREAS